MEGGKNCLETGVASLKLVALGLLDRKLERKGGRLPEVGVLGLGRAAGLGLIAISG